MPLTPRQRRFVEEYLIDLDAKAAAVRAGYAETTARAMTARLMRRPEVAAAITEGERDAARMAGLRRVEVLRGLMKEAKGAGEGGARVRAWELLGRHLGMFTERLAVGISLEQLVLGAGGDTPPSTAQAVLGLGPQGPLPEDSALGVQLR